MKIFAAVAGGIAGLIVGWIATISAVVGLGEYVGISNFEGQRDIMAVFGFGPVGGLIGLVIGALLAWRAARK